MKLTARTEEEKLRKITFWKQLTGKLFVVPLIIVLLIINNVDVAGIWSTLLLIAGWMLLLLTPTLLLAYIVLIHLERSTIARMIDASDEETHMYPYSTWSLGRTSTKNKPYRGARKGIKFEYRRGGIINKTTTIILENSRKQHLPNNITINGLTYQKKTSTLFGNTKYTITGEARISDVGPLLKEIEKHWQH